MGAPSRKVAAPVFSGHAHSLIEDSALNWLLYTRYQVLGTRYQTMITDCHIHIQPVEMFKAAPLEVMKRARGSYDDILEYCRSPKSLLKYLDSVGVERTVLINYVAPDVMGFTFEVNQWVADYCKEDPKRLVPCGSLHPRHSTNVTPDM